KAVEIAGFKARPNRPDLHPTHEALQLVEPFQEIARHCEAKERRKDLPAATEAARGRAADLENALRACGDISIPEARKGADAAFVAPGKRCTTCQAAHRDH